jgi:hypothetical protein
MCRENMGKVRTTKEISEVKVYMDLPSVPVSLFQIYCVCVVPSLPEEELLAFVE